MATLLIIDDEPNVLYSLSKTLRTESLNIVTASSAREGLAQIETGPVDTVIVDVCLPDMSGLEVVAALRNASPNLPVIVITAFTTTETAIEAMKRGAFDYLLKPVDLHLLRETVKKALDLNRLRRVTAVPDEARPDDFTVDHIVGRSPAMQEVYKAVGRVAPQDVTVLVQGESGTGKELVARALYHHSHRNKGPFLALNCAAIPETLLESELFGHERGAFTGANRRRIGKFEQANGGTLFLDEIGDMTSATQAKVLRILQDQQFERVGSSDTIKTDVRVIAATNSRLEDMVQAGLFRKDLYYRLKVFSIQLPPLRERSEDIPLLIDHFLHLVSYELKKTVRAISPEAQHLLEQYSWPGNVRELQSAIKYAIIHASGDTLIPEYLPEEIRNPVRPNAPPARGFDVRQFVEEMLNSGERDIHRKVSDAVDAVILPLVLQFTDGNQGEASDLLGISRTTLRAKLRGLGLSVEKQVQSQSSSESSSPVLAD
jgi:two-component system nitrogen regulation response regulator GlnG